MQGYGNGPSTGLDQTAAGKILTGFRREDLFMSPQDRAVLRALAERVAEIAASDADGGGPPPVDGAQRAATRSAAGLLRSGERLERDHHRGPDAVPRQARPPLGDGPPQGDLLGRGDGRRQAGRAVLRRALHRLAGRLGPAGRLPQDRRGRLVRLGGADPRLRPPICRSCTRRSSRSTGRRPAAAWHIAQDVFGGILTVRLEGHLVVVAGADLAGGHVPRPAEHALRLHRPPRRAEGTACRCSRAATWTSSTTWKPRAC